MRSEAGGNVRKSLTVGIGGLGAIGRQVAAAIDAGVEGLELVAVSARDLEGARAKVAGFARPPKVVRLGELGALADIVVECAPAAVFEEVAEPAIRAGRIFVPSSVGALLPRMHLVDLARETGARIVVPTGALLGLDAVRAVAEGTIHSVRMVTRKPPGGLSGAPHLVENGISVEGLTEPKKVFEGTAREGARGFPANVNVAAALSLAGIGPDRTTLEIWADPALDRNTHRIEVDADSARFTLEIANVPSEENPRTGKNTGLSVIAALRGLTSTLKVGT
ncbi:aspartate dehydrogenase [Constrictibacter sp. MBR-5]|jgi:aspartate dehydrogenase|uniref:aspartate dehydrogenase n=1 Tax=Constrictibacter sp. MBR-5 TaxID=3156467 RepID=UPI00339642DE